MPKNVFNFNVDNVRVCKILGGSLQASEVVQVSLQTPPTLLYPSLPFSTLLYPSLHFSTLLYTSLIVS
jgi:hypothetical protein